MWLPRMPHDFVTQPTLKFFVSTAVSCDSSPITEAFRQVRKLLFAVARHLGEYFSTEKLSMFTTWSPSSKPSSRTQKYLSNDWVIGPSSGRRYSERAFR